MSTPTLQRPSAASRVAADPAWRKAPTVLARTPGVLAAVIGAALLLGAAAASGPLYLSSARSAMLHAEVGALSPTEAGWTVELPVVPTAEALSAVGEALDGGRAGVAGLDPARRHARSVPVTLQVEGAEVRVRLVADGLTIPSGGGLRAPAELDLGEGTQVAVRSGRRQTPAQISEVGPTPRDGDLPELLGSLPLVLDLAAQAGAAVTMTWVHPLDSSEVDPEMAARRLRGLVDAAQDRRTGLGGRLAEIADVSTRVRSESELPAAFRRAQAGQAALAGPILGLWAAALLVGLGVLVGTALLRARRRRWELSILAVRGVPPASQGGRALLESTAPLVVGVAAGAGVALVAVAGLGPGGLVTEGVRPGVVAAAVAASAALLLIAAATAASVRNAGVGASRRRTRLGRAPWELLPLALAVLTYQRMGTAAQTAGMDPLQLAFPALALAGAIPAAARLLGTQLGHLRRMGTRSSAAVMLALRRLAASPGATIGLVATAGVAVGLLTTASTVAASATDTARAKAELAVGAEAAGPVGFGEATPGAGTSVVHRGRGVLRPGDLEVDVLLVVPETFADVASWRPSFADRDLSGLLAVLAAAPAGTGARAPVPAILVGAPATARPTALAGGGLGFPITVAARAAAFPGLGPDRPLIVLDRAVVEAASGSPAGPPLLRTEVWATGGESTAVQRAVAAGALTDELRTLAAEADTAPLRATRWTLAYLQAVAAVAGLLAALALGLALAERQRPRDVSYVLTRRMGLARAAHRRAVLAELGALLTAALVLGGGLGLLVARLAAPAADPLPALPPAPLFTVPWAVLGIMVGVAALLCVLGAAAVQRHADRVRMGEVLRAGE